MNPNATGLRYAEAAHAKLDRRQANSRGNGHDHPGHTQINVGEVERHLSMIGGTVLAVCGLLRGSLSGLTLAAIGGALIWRGHTGHCETYHMLGYNSACDSERAGECQTGMGQSQQLPPSQEL